MQNLHHHPNLLRAYELFEGRDHYYIIMDLCLGGDLCQELDAWGRLEEDDAALLMKQLLNVLAFLHTHRIVHANVKPEHILLLDDDKDLDNIKLTDFSCAHVMDEEEYADEDDDDDDDDDDINHHDAISRLDRSLDDTDDMMDPYHANPLQDSLPKQRSRAGVQEYPEIDGPIVADHDTEDDDDEEERVFELDNPQDRSQHPSNKNTDVRGGGKRNTSKSKIMPERRGTPEFWAPEVCLTGSIRPKRDVWACGVLCYLLLSNRFPFQGKTREDISERIIRGEFSFRDGGGPTNDDDGDDDDDYFDGYSNAASFYSDYLEGDACPEDNNFRWSTVSENARSFIRSLLTYEEEDRPTARQALQHPWIVEATKRRNEKHNSRFSCTSANSGKNEFFKSMATLAAWNNVAKFNATNKLKQATLALVAAQMVLKEERNAIDHIFRTLDIHNDGRLSRKEVRIGYKECFKRSLTEEELDDLFKRVDLNQTGYIEYSEFLVAAMNEHDILHRQKIQQAFSVFDKDGSGTIDKNDLKQVLTHFKGGQQQDEGTDPVQDVIDDAAIDKIIKQADASGDGHITYEDFMALMLKTTDDDGEETEPPIPSITGIERGAPERQQTPGNLSIDSMQGGLTMLKFTTNDFGVAQSPGELTNFYEIKDFIDEGGFGKVYVCRHKATDAERALKIIDKSRWRKVENSKVVNEFELLKSMDHPNIVRFYELFQDRQHFYLVMDICKVRSIRRMGLPEEKQCYLTFAFLYFSQGGDLCDEIDAWGKVSEENATILMTQLLSCLNYIHTSHKVVHRDLKVRKGGLSFFICRSLCARDLTPSIFHWFCCLYAQPDNILLEQQREFSHIKVIDFGLACRFDDDVEMTARVGTAEYSKYKPGLTGVESVVS